MRSDVLKSEIKVVEANTAEELTQRINEELDNDWKLLLSSYQVCADQGQRFYSTLMTKDRYIEDPNQLTEEPHDAPSALSM